MSVPSELLLARGAVRDGVSSVKNLDQLLGSLRVGPRQLPHAISGVREGCAALGAALSALEAAMAEPLAGDPAGYAALQAVLGHGAQRVIELDEALLESERAPIDARARLRLEGIVRKVALDLDTVVRLIDLIGLAAVSRSTVIDLGEVLAERRPPSRNRTPVLAVVELHAPVLVGDARIVLDLLEFAVARVVRAGVSAPRIVAERREDGVLVIDVGPVPGRPLGQARRPDLNPRTTRILDVSLRPELPREWELVIAAGRRAGITLEVSPDGRLVKISL